MAQWNNGPLMGINGTQFIPGQIHHGPLMGQELQMVSYGPKDIMGHTWDGSYNGLESYLTAQMKLLGLIPIGRNGPGVSGP